MAEQVALGDGRERAAPERHDVTVSTPGDPAARKPSATADYSLSRPAHIGSHVAVEETAALERGGARGVFAGAGRVTLLDTSR